jgi:creatinine amidohydrolase
MEYSDLTELGREAEDAVRKQERGTHADEIETSMLLHIAPEVVKLHLAKRDDNPRISKGPLTRDAGKKAGIYSPTGAWGDPTLATAEKGRLVLEAIMKEIAAFLAIFSTPDYVPQAVRQGYMPE